MGSIIVVKEIHQVNTVVAKTGGILKVMADYDNLKDRQTVKLQGVCSDLGVSLANMADRHEFVKLPSGIYACTSTTNMSQRIRCA